MPHLMMMFAFSLVAPIATCALTVVAGITACPGAGRVSSRRRELPICPFVRARTTRCRERPFPPRVRIAGRRLVARVW